MSYKFPKSLSKDDLEVYFRNTPMKCIILFLNDYREYSLLAISIKPRIIRKLKNATDDELLLALKKDVYTLFVMSPKQRSNTVLLAAFKERIHFIRSLTNIPESVIYKSIEYHKTTYAHNSITNIEEVIVSLIFSCQRGKQELSYDLLYYFYNLPSSQYIKELIKDSKNWKNLSPVDLILSKFED